MASPDHPPPAASPAFKFKPKKRKAGQLQQPTQKKPDSRSSPNPNPNPNPPRESTAPATQPAWEQGLDITSMSIISSSHIQQKVKRVLEELAPGSARVGKLHARAAAAAKMITVVEIAKREIRSSGGEWFQYSMVGQVVEEQKKKSEVEQEEGGEGEGEEEEEGFETMKTPFERANEGRPNVRASPVMTVYLSRVRIEALRKACGEQTNALEGAKA